jgi:hypothetical protein
MTERIDTKGKTMWAPVRNWKDHRTDVQARRLVHERESLLSGRYAFELQARRIPVSPWAWVSALAHSSRDQLVELSANVRPRSWRPHDPAARWQAAAAFLAMELLTTADPSGWELERLQRQAVLPFDLGEVSSTAGTSWIKPAEFVRGVRGAVARFRDGSYPQ